MATLKLYFAETVFQGEQAAWVGVKVDGSSETTLPVSREDFTANLSPGIHTIECRLVNPAQDADGKRMAAIRLATLDDVVLPNTMAMQGAEPITFSVTVAHPQPSNPTDALTSAEFREAMGVSTKQYEEMLNAVAAFGERAEAIMEEIKVAVTKAVTPPPAA